MVTTASQKLFRIRDGLTLPFARKRPRRRRNRIVDLTVEVTEARVLLSSTAGLSGGLNNVSPRSNSDGHNNSSDRQRGAGDNHRGQSQSGQQQSDGRQSGSHNPRNGGHSGSRGNSSPATAPTNPMPATQPQQPVAPTATPQPVPTSPSAPSSGSTTPASETPAASPLSNEPAESPQESATPPAPADSGTNDAPASDVDESTTSIDPSNSATTVDADARAAGADVAAILSAITSSTRLTDGHPTRLDHITATDSVFVLATVENGGYVEALEDDIEGTPEETGSTTASPDQRAENHQAGEAATRNALTKLKSQTESTGRSTRALAGSVEGGFIELAVNRSGVDQHRHPLLDDQTRGHRSSEADASIGRVIAFDSADSEYWNAVAETYSMTYEPELAETAAPEASSPTPATSAFATACGAGALLTSSEVIRRRWGNRLLSFARRLLRLVFHS